MRTHKILLGTELLRVQRAGLVPRLRQEGKRLPGAKWQSGGAQPALAPVGGSPASLSDRNANGSGSSPAGILFKPPPPPSPQRLLRPDPQQCPLPFLPCGVPQLEMNPLPSAAEAVWPIGTVHLVGKGSCGMGRHPAELPRKGIGGLSRGTAVFICCFRLRPGLNRLLLTLSHLPLHNHAKVWKGRTLSHGGPLQSCHSVLPGEPASPDQTPGTPWALAALTFVSAEQDYSPNSPPGGAPKEPQLLQLNDPSGISWPFPPTRT